MRIAAVGDVHCSKTLGRPAPGAVRRGRGSTPTCSLLCGDLTHHGLPDEAGLLVRELKAATRAGPRGARQPRLRVERSRGAGPACSRRAGSTCSTARPGSADDVGFAGVKGFGGGFGECEPRPLGRAGAQAFVQESRRRRPSSSSAPWRRCARGAASPSCTTRPSRPPSSDEPLEIHPFLGSSRLRGAPRPLPRDVTFHGHAHKGSLEGRTRGGRPVYNVALPLLRASRPELPLLVVDLDDA